MLPHFCKILEQHQPCVLSYVRADMCVGLSVRFFSSSVMSSGVPLFPSSCVLRKGCPLSLCLSSRKWSGLGDQAQCLDTDVADPGFGLELIVLYLATVGGYFCYCCLILSGIVSVPSRSVCSCLLTSKCLWCIAA